MDRLPDELRPTAVVAAGGASGWDVTAADVAYWRERIISEPRTVVRGAIRGGPMPPPTDDEVDELALQCAIEEHEDLDRRAAESDRRRAASGVDLGRRPLRVMV